MIVMLIAFFPTMLIEALWNTTVGKAYSDFSINFWQAAILWLVFIVTLHIVGIFKFEFAVEKIDSIENIKGNPEKKLENNKIKEKD